MSTSPSGSNGASSSRRPTTACSGVALVGDSSSRVYLKDASSRVEGIRPDRQARARRRTARASARPAALAASAATRETFYSFTSFTTPATIYRYDLATAKSTVFRQPKVDFDPDRLRDQASLLPRARTARACRCSSLPQEGLEARRQQPDAPLRLRRVQHLAHAGVSTCRMLAGWRWAACTPCRTCAAAANMAASGTRRACKHNKQNVFDDFHRRGRVADREQVHVAGKARHRGGSNGGLLVGAAMTQRPELFAAALPAVGVMDMLRFHKFTIGWAWVPEYGSRRRRGRVPDALASTRRCTILQAGHAATPPR